MRWPSLNLLQRIPHSLPPPAAFSRTRFDVCRPNRSLIEIHRTAESVILAARSEMHINRPDYPILTPRPVIDVGPIEVILGAAESPVGLSADGLLAQADRFIGAERMAISAKVVALAPVRPVPIVIMPVVGRRWRRSLIRTLRHDRRRRCATTPRDIERVALRPARLVFDLDDRRSPVSRILDEILAATAVLSRKMKGGGSRRQRPGALGPSPRARLPRRACEGRRYCREFPPAPHRLPPLRWCTYPGPDRLPASWSPASDCSDYSERASRTP